MDGGSKSRSVRSSCVADGVLLKQVYMNLISNALKFTRTREVAKIALLPLVRERSEHLLVQDNGVGLHAVRREIVRSSRLHRAENLLNRRRWPPQPDHLPTAETCWSNRRSTRTTMYFTPQEEGSMMDQTCRCPAAEDNPDDVLALHAFKATC
jgi:hypothetical protein